MTASQMPRSMEKFMGSETTGLQPLASAAVSSTGWQPSATGSAISVNAEAATKRLLQAKRADNDRATAASLELRSEEHTSELPSLMRISYCVLCLNKKTIQNE